MGLGRKTRDARRVAMSRKVRQKSIDAFQKTITQPIHLSNWPKENVWSLVCATELGLVGESSRCDDSSTLNDSYLQFANRSSRESRKDRICLLKPRDIKNKNSRSYCCFKPVRVFRTAWPFDSNVNGVQRQRRNSNVKIYRKSQRTRMPSSRKRIKKENKNSPAPLELETVDIKIDCIDLIDEWDTNNRDKNDCTTRQNEEDPLKCNFEVDWNNPNVEHSTKCVEQHSANSCGKPNRGRPEHKIKKSAKYHRPTIVDRTDRRPVVNKSLPKSRESNIFKHDFDVDHALSFLQAATVDSSNPIVKGSAEFKDCTSVSKFLKESKREYLETMEDDFDFRHSQSLKERIFEKKYYPCKNRNGRTFISRKSIGNRFLCRRRQSKCNFDEPLFGARKINGNNTFEKNYSASNRYHDVHRITRGYVRSKEKFAGKLVWGSCMGWWPAFIIDADDVGMKSKPGKVWVYWIGESRISQLSEKTQVETFSSNLKARLINNLCYKTATKLRVAASIATLELLAERLGIPLVKPYHVWAEEHVLGLNDLDDLDFYPYPYEVKERLEELKEEYKIKSDSLEKKRSSKQSTSLKNNQKKSKSGSMDSLYTGYLPIMNQKPGTIVWAKILGQNWWPAMILDHRDCGIDEPKFGCQWIIWYGDYKLSEVNHRYFLKFEEGIQKMHDYILQTKRDFYVTGVLDACKDYCSRLDYNTDGWTMDNVFKWISELKTNPDVQSIPRTSPKTMGSANKLETYSPQIVGKLRELKGEQNVAADREHNIRNSSTIINNI